MATPASGALNQKFAHKNFVVYFDVNESLLAEELLDAMDRSIPAFKQLFSLSEDPTANFFLLKNEQDFENTTGVPAKAGETIRLDYKSNTVFFLASKFSGSMSEVAVRELAHLIFNNMVNERELQIRCWRSPSWLREGFALQAVYKARNDSREWLQSGWSKLQEAQRGDQLIKPTVMARDVNLIPDSGRRQLALYQAYYMVRLLLSIHCDGFFTKYSTLMHALEDMEAEACFRQITGYDFEKFFNLFNDWVKRTNAWSAIE